MAEFIIALGYSLLFALVAAAIALLLSLLLILVRCSSVNAYLRTGIWRRLSDIPELLASVCESVPLLILLVLLGQTSGRQGFTPVLEYLLKSLVLGFFMFPSIWRYLDNRLDLANEEVYPRQMMLWKISSLKVGVHYVILKNNLSGLLSSVIWVFTTAFTLDLSVGLLLHAGFGRSYINWFDGALGVLVGKNLRRFNRIDGSSALYLLIAFALIFLLYQLAQKLIPHFQPVYNKVREKQDRDLAAQYSFTDVQLQTRGLDLGIDPQAPLNLQEGEFVWLNGPSGSGKSLFIKALLGLISDGEQEQSVLRRQPVIICRDSLLSEASVIMPQEPDLYIFPYLSVKDYIACLVGTDVERLSQTVRAAYSGDGQDNMLKLLRVVASIQDTQVRSLSAGEKRMVAIVVAMAQSLQPDKKIIIFDEPDSSLDANAIKALKFYLGSVNTRSVIYITHNVMHSRDIYAALDRLGIWELMPDPDREGKQIIRAVQDVEGHYQKVHAAIQTTLSDITNLFSGQDQANRASGEALLSISFPLNIELGRGLKLRASLNGQPQRELRVRSGDGLIGIVGDNGIGKSSFLRAVLGMHSTREASISLGNGSSKREQSTRAAIREHGICYVYDDIEKALPGNLPLIEVIKNLKKVHGRGIADTKFIKTFGSDMLHRPLTRFSGGERQKIVFDLVCHVIDARLLLLDEPFSRLDWGENLIQVSQWLRHKASLCPVIIISHNREILEAMAPENTWLLEAN